MGGVAGLGPGPGFEAGARALLELLAGPGGGGPQVAGLGLEASEELSPAVIVEGREGAQQRSFAQVGGLAGKGGGQRGGAVEEPAKLGPGVELGAAGGRFEARAPGPATKAKVVAQAVESVVARARGELASVCGRPSAAMERSGLRAASLEVVPPGYGVDKRVGESRWPSDCGSLALGGALVGALRPFAVGELVGKLAGEPSGDESVALRSLTSSD